jgi:hypothetical protein
LGSSSSSADSSDTETSAAAVESMRLCVEPPQRRAAGAGVTPHSVAARVDEPWLSPLRALSLGAGKETEEVA